MPRENKICQRNSRRMERSLSLNRMKSRKKILRSTKQISSLSKKTLVIKISQQ